MELKYASPVKAVAFIFTHDNLVVIRFHHEACIYIALYIDDRLNAKQVNATHIFLKYIKISLS